MEAGTNLAIGNSEMGEGTNWLDFGSTATTHTPATYTTANMVVNQ